MYQCLTLCHSIVQYDECRTIIAIVVMFDGVLEQQKERI